MRYGITRECLECGKIFEPRQHNADFCGSVCRKKFNNRRATRGAVLYDLAMVQETYPDTYAKNDLSGKAIALVQKWADEDRKAGRKRTHKRVYDVRFDVAALLR